jgi:hypothetical protein
MGLLLAPAERADIIIDFSDFPQQTLLVLNTANAPYPSGDLPDPKTNGQVMQFRVDLPRQGEDTSFNPAAPAAMLRGGKHQPPAIIRLSETRPRHDRAWRDDLPAPTTHLDRSRRRWRSA